MKTRIRELRKRRGLTLQQLADSVGTTAQTIQRLETGNMTISLDWMEKIAAAFGVTVGDLLTSERASAPVELIGTVGADCRVVPGGTGNFDNRLPYKYNGQESIAVRLDVRIGPHEKGTVLVADKLTGADIAQADGRDCLIATNTGDILLGRIALVGAKPIISMPYEEDASVPNNLGIAWLAPVAMSIRYYS